MVSYPLDNPDPAIYDVPTPEEVNADLAAGAVNEIGATTEGRLRRVTFTAEHMPSGLICSWSMPDGERALLYRSDIIAFGAALDAANERIAGLEKENKLWRDAALRAQKALRETELRAAERDFDASDMGD